MHRYSKSASRATRWAQLTIGRFDGVARYAVSAVVWSAAIVWIAALMVVATGAIVADATKSARTGRDLRHRLREAERAHRRAVRDAEEELARCQSAYDKSVASAQQHLATLRDPRGKRLKRCQGVTLFERTIATPQGTVSLVGVRASVDTAGNLAVTKRATLTRTAAGALVAGPVGAVVGGAGFKKTKKIDTRELYLNIEAPTLSCVVRCPPDSGARVRSFAAAVNTAASLAATDEPRRPHRIRLAEEALAAAQAARDPVEAAQRKAAKVAVDPHLLATVDSARQELDAYRRSAR